MRITRNVIEKLVICVLLLTFAINVCSVSANAMQALDGSIDGLWEGISNPFPAQPTNAIDFVDTINDGTNVSPDDYLGYATKWNGNGDTRVKSTELIDGQNTDVLEVTNTYNRPWQAGRWGMTPLFTTQDISGINSDASKVKSCARWSVDMKIVLGEKTSSTSTVIMCPMGWLTNDNRATEMSSAKTPFLFSRKNSENKYTITNLFDNSESVDLDSGKWYRFQIEFVVDNYEEKTASSDSANSATISTAIYGFDEHSMLNATALAKWDNHSWDVMSKIGDVLLDTLCQELCVVVRNSNITSYSVANAYMVREAWFGDVRMLEETDKVKASAKVYPQYVAGGNYMAPVSNDTPVLVLAGYDDLNTLVSSKGDISNISTEMTCEVEKKNKISRYSAYLWKSPNNMQLFAAPKELSLTSE